MQVSHATPTAVASFDDPNLVSAAGLPPIMRLAETAGLRSLADHWLSVPTDKGANAGKKVSSLVGGMVAGAHSIDDHGDFFASAVEMKPWLEAHPDGSMIPVAEAYQLGTTIAHDMLIEANLHPVRSVDYDECGMLLKPLRRLQSHECPV